MLCVWQTDGQSWIKVSFQNSSTNKYPPNEQTLHLLVLMVGMLEGQTTSNCMIVWAFNILLTRLRQSREAAGICKMKMLEVRQDATGIPASEAHDDLTALSRKTSNEVTK